jgi:hypothetical protein
MYRMPHRYVIRWFNLLMLRLFNKPVRIPIPDNNDHMLSSKEVNGLFEKMWDAGWPEEELMDMHRALRVQALYPENSNVR